ncbi:MAG: IPT/TIG domain-containing protein [Solirubrobacteraceae bacterium]
MGVLGVLRVTHARRWASVTALALVFTAPAAATAAVTSRVPLNPLGAINYLAAQRAGFGSPAHAAKLAARADARARTLQAATRAIANNPRAHLGPTPAVSGPAGAWTPLGPAPMAAAGAGGQNTGAPNSGRVDSIAVVQSGPNAGEIFVGTAGGGVWSSTNNGVSWVTHTDQVATGLAIGAIAVDPVNPSIIYAGTGEANNCGDCFYGGGVLKSTDGGNTWTVENPTSVQFPNGLFAGVDFGSIAVDPHNDQHLFAGTTNGFYVSTDGGATWSQPAAAANFTAATWGIALDPTTSPTTVYIATAGVGIQKSTTGGGGGFTTLAGGLPAPAVFGTTELGIGSGASGHMTLYAAIARGNNTTDTNGGVLSMYKTTNGGGSWSPVAIPPYADLNYAYDTSAAAGGAQTDQSSYDNTIVVDPANPSHVLVAGIAMVESTDGGATWNNVDGPGGYFRQNTNPLHPDFHALVYAPSGNVVIGNDGGVYEYAARATFVGPAGVTDLNTNLNTGQFYEDLGIFGNGAKILGGLQDNGTVFYTGNQSWPQVDGGDGGSSVINPLDANQQFAESPGLLDLTTNGWSNLPATTTITPPGSTAGNFTEPLAIVPNSGSADSPTIYFGMLNLWRGLPTGGSSWKQLTTYGSVIGNVTNAVSAVAVAPSNPDVVYVAFDDGTVMVTPNATATTPTFTAISPQAGNPAQGQWVTHIDVSPTSPGMIALSFSGSNTHLTATPPMVETATVNLTTPAATYTNITGNLPTGVASNSVVSVAGGYAVATDVGVFFTASPSGASTTWTAVGTGLPNIQVLGLSTDSQGDLFAATHGRGAWLLQPPPSVSSISPTSGPAIGGTAVTLTGTFLAGATAVNFGSAAGTITNDTPTRITATSPAGAGAVAVTVTTPSGTSAASASNTFTYVGVPSAQITTPANGATFTLGQAVTSSFSCTAGASGTLQAGTAGCLGTVANGSAVPTSTSGAQTFTVKATDTLGQSVTVTSNYTVSGPPPPATTSAPANTSAPVISGSPLPSNTLSCSTGSWSGSPTKFTYQWNRDGVPIAGATSSSYLVQIADEAHTLTCVVTATGPGGVSAPAKSAGVFVGDSTALGCPKPSGSISGKALGPLSIGISRKSAERKLTHHTTTGVFENFCLFAGFGIRVSYKSHKIVIALTANPFYSLSGVSPGASLSTAMHTLTIGKPIVIGADTWYVASRGKANGILKVRGGIVYEVGLVNKSLSRTAKAQKKLLSSLGL